MRLSDAIAMGRVFIEKPEAMDYCRCAIGMAMASLEGSQLPSHRQALKEAFEAWPFMVKFVPVPEKLVRVSGGWRNRKPQAIEYWISTLFFRVQEGKLTLEELCDWVRSVEPSEEYASEEAPAAAIHSLEVRS